MIYDTKLGVGGDDTAADLVHWDSASHWGSARSWAAKEADSVTGTDPDESEESRETAAILIVEDEALNALYISSVLEVCGYEVIGVTATAAEALDLAAGHVPDLVLMDITLRGEVDGIAAARSLQERLGVPILFVTAHADAPTLARARAINPAGYLLKPFTARQLETAVRKALASA